MHKPHPAIIATGFCVWFLGGIGLVLLFAGVSDEVHRYRYAFIAAGSAIMLLPAIWIRTPAGIWRSMRREEMVEHASRLILFALGIVAILAVGLLGIAKPLTAPAILVAVFLGYFVLGTHTLGALLARSRLKFYNSHCPHCLYDLSAIESPTCPECGRAITPPQTAANKASRR